MKLKMIILSAFTMGFSIGAAGGSHWYFSADDATADLELSRLLESHRLEQRSGFEREMAQSLRRVQSQVTDWRKQRGYYRPIMGGAYSDRLREVERELNALRADLELLRGLPEEDWSDYASEVKLRYETFLRVFTQTLQRFQAS